jgi:hypothetical protein
MHGRQLADRGERPGALVGQGAAERIGQPERGCAADAIGVEAGQEGL